MSGKGRTAVSAVALPIRLSGGQAAAACCTSEQLLRSVWSSSLLTASGSVSCTRLPAASPTAWVTATFMAGRPWWPTVPEAVMATFGAKASLSQSVGVNWVLRLTGSGDS